VKTFVTLLIKEERAVFSSPIAYAVMAVFLGLLGYTFVSFLFVSKVATLLHIFLQTFWLFLLMLPVVTMRVFAEERKSGTLELILTAPVKEVEIVIAKFLASLTIVGLMLTLSVSYALVIGLYGAPDWGPIYSGYLGLILLGGALVGIGVLVSALTANQLVAATVTLGIFLLLSMIDTLGSLLPDPLDTLVVNFSLLAHFVPFATGSLFLSDLGFFLSVIAASLFLSVRALARR
jgi:ABC-2 type transport system permease protein